MWKINTSNPGKLKELQHFFALHGICVEVTHFDLDEIDADPIQVIAHKASQLEEGVIVEDTSLDVEGADVGVNVRWLLDHLVNYIGHKAVWTVLLAYRQNDEVLIYKGSMSGTIVMPRKAGPTSFGFDPIFLPDGTDQTLAEFKSDALSARGKAVEALVKGNLFSKHPVIDRWEGPWQQ